MVEVLALILPDAVAYVVVEQVVVVVVVDAP